MNLKKIFKLCFILLMLLILTSCDFSESEKTTNNNITHKITTVEDFTIGDFQTALWTAIEKAEASVISVVHSEGGWLGSTSLGSGVIIKQEEIKGANDQLLGYKYLAVTNRHVVVTSRNTISKNLEVYLGIGDNVVNATCTAYSQKEDLALLSFNSRIDLPVASLADTTNLKKGTFVVAVGSPYSLDFYQSATFGIVSYPLRYLDDEAFSGYGYVQNTYIQHDAPINAGNSGGGLFNIEGKLIGINTLKIQSDAENIVEGMGFSIPTHIVLEVFKDYL